jgi:PDZ domain-containing protein
VVPEVRLPSHRQRWSAIPLAALAVLVPFVIGIASVLPAEWVAEEIDPRTEELTPTPYARTPSSAQPVGDRLTIGDLGEAAERFPAEGDVYFVTVTETAQSVLSWWLGGSDPAVEFLTTEERFGLQTPGQRRIFALESMRTSEQVAQFVALKAVGFDVELVPGDVLIQQIVCLEPAPEGADPADCVTAPSDEFLDPGDRLIEADGVALEGVEDLTRIVSAKEPGDTVDLRIDRPEVGELDVTVELTASPTDPDRTIVGFVPFDTRRVVLPFELDIDTGRIGGPSAGLAFTLTLIDELTPGELTGGGSVAVTGTIELDGSVGAIGGLRQKASAVAQAGVDVFLVPAAQGEADIEAARVAGGEGLRIIPVATLEEAVAALEELGGDPIELTPIATTTGP